MGQQLPQISNHIPTLQRQDQFESKYIQRVKSTPFIDAEIYNTHPLVFTDPTGPTLAGLIQPRLGTKQLFPEEDIEKLIVNVMNGLKDLQDNGFAGHGDVSLETIYYSKKQKYFKLAHPIFNGESAYILVKNGKRFSALSPEQLSALADNSQKSEVSQKSDIFTFGIALCEVCTLTPSSDIYCPDTYSIFHLQIQKRLKIMEEYYSNNISMLARDCLQYDPADRLNATQILEHLSSLKNPSVTETIVNKQNPRP